MLRIITRTMMVTAPDLNPDAVREPVDPDPQDPVQEEGWLVFVVVS